jgi:hypothetical protein
MKTSKLLYHWFIYFVLFVFFFVSALNASAQPTKRHKCKGWHKTMLKAKTKSMVRYR